MGLDYDYPEKKKACSEGPMAVKYDGRPFGEIRKVKDGYQFFATGCKTGEPVHSALSGVQASLVSVQPSKKEKKADVIKGGEREDQQSAGMMKKVKKDLKAVNAKLEGAVVLLTAAYELLEKQTAAEDVLNLLNENVMCGETEVDGMSLMEDISSFLEDS